MGEISWISETQKLSVSAGPKIVNFCCFILFLNQIRKQLFKGLENYCNFKAKLLKSLDALLLG
jgi:hypothetical protein